MTRTPAPVSCPVTLTIAGSDSGGGAGIQADLKTMEAQGAFGTTIVTAVTAQNTQGVADSHVLPLDQIQAQYDAVIDDFDVQAIKTGMLATESVVTTVTDNLVGFDGPVVVDPVMVAASGDRLLDPAAEDAYEDLIAAATLVTPNLAETEVLTGETIETDGDAETAGEQLLELGADAALIKGGHRDDELITDVLMIGAPEGDQPTVHRFEHPRIDTDATHGSGCTLSSAITARLAHGDPLDVAVEESIGFMERAVRYAHDAGQGPGAVHHLAGLREEADRHRTMESVEWVVEQFVARNVRPLVPEVGMNVVGATPYAEAVAETAAVEGRITKTLSGIAPNRGVRLGASSHVARFLLASREHESDYRFAVNCRFDSDVEAALEALDGPVVAYDRSAEPEGVKAAEGSTMQWGARQAFEQTEASPVAVIDRGEVGKEAIVKLLARDAAGLVDRTIALLDELQK